MVEVLTLQKLTDAANQFLLLVDKHLSAYHWTADCCSVPGAANSTSVGSGGQREPSGKEMQVLVVEWHAACLQ